MIIIIIITIHSIFFQISRFPLDSNLAIVSNDSFRFDLRVADAPNPEVRMMKAPGYTILSYAPASVHIIVRDSDKSSLHRLRELESPIIFEPDQPFARNSSIESRLWWCLLGCLRSLEIRWLKIIHRRFSSFSIKRITLTTSCVHLKSWYVLFDSYILKSISKAKDIVFVKLI